MKQWINRITWALLFYLVFLIATLPAYLVVSRIQLDKNIQLGNVSGTIWSGKIDTVKVDKTLVKDVTWDVNFAQLLAARFAVDIEFGSPRKNLEPQGSSQLRYGLNGASVADLQIKLPADLIAQQINLPFKVQAAGLVDANISTMQLGEPVCQALDGQINWKLAAVNLIEMKTNFSYGDIKANLSCDENGAALAKILGNPELLRLDIDAKLTSFSSYSVNGFISAGSNASQDLRNALSYLGKADSQGRYSIKF
ncbi:type II secretion system protein N [Catenovulum sp. 2E275]|uniref:type II secretion system protein N n=1 Tax=Catenovulum sp. 2E275 TaxID=2980497 RepID=UPI0021CFB579|nr:type II secretion system protein N [Catenovulum sp. 2E275]MCU4674384.1 type II secretion system protein N [Catenovulum sp. 2E275]